MKTIGLMCDKDSRKPKIRLEEHADLLCLIDTGADMPVWCRSVKIFLKAFPNAQKLNYRFVLTGFGGDKELPMVEVTDVYMIPEFIFGSKNDNIICRGMLVAMSKRRGIGADLVLPYTMFEKSRITIDGMIAPRKLEITIRNNEIWLWYEKKYLDPDDELYENYHKFYHDYCGLSEEEIKDNQIINNIRALVQGENSEAIESNAYYEFLNKTDRRVRTEL